jgi:tRNA(Ile)-lysidine synthase
MLPTLFNQAWQTNFSWIKPGNSHLLLAISGGADSVALAYLLKAGGFQLSFLHCNFQLRGEESDRDEQFVRSLAIAMELPLQVVQLNTRAYMEQEKLSVQEAARNLRYQWFAEQLKLAREQYPDQTPYLVTAHHADDNTETLLFHLFRGTGLNGLTGMEAYRKDLSLIRPLLPFDRAAIHAYLNEIGAAHVEDSSNSKNDYSRNFIRNEVIPVIRQGFPNLQQNLHHTLYRLREAASLYDEALQNRLNQLLLQQDHGWKVPVELWKQQQPLHTITYELIRRFGFSPAQTIDAIRLLDAGTGSQLSSSSHRMIRNRNWILIAPLLEEHTQELYVWAEEEKQVTLPDAQLEKEWVIDLTIPTHDPHTVLVNAEALQAPLTIRKWRIGDYFYPLGLGKKKKLSRFFIDQKLSALQKEQIWVLSSGDRIVWVIGQRIDHRFRITPGSRQGLLIRYRAR